MTDSFVIVGGDAAGMSAASKAKRDAPEMDVVVLERGEWVSYGACGLPYYVRGAIADVEDLVVLDPRKVVDERGIDLRRHHEVVALDRENRTVTVERDDGRYEESYDDLLLATGGRATVPDVPGTELQGVFTIRNLEAGRSLRTYIEREDRPIPGSVEPGRGKRFRSHVAESRPDRVGILGANKIGIEFAEAFLGRGWDVHVFDPGERVLPSFGSDVAEMVDTHLREEGVELHMETPVQAFRGRNGRVSAIETIDGSIPVGTVVLDVGVDPNVEIGVEAGIERGPTGAIATDEYGRTNDPNVFAAGDCAEKRHRLTGEAIHWPYALAANRAGRSIGTTVAGTPTPVGGIVGTQIMKALDLQVARTGIVEHREAVAAGFEPVSAEVTTITRAHYYPGWSRMVVHATADADTGRLLGANMVAEEGAAHRINSVATAITAGMTVDDVGSLDFGYSPPFGPVWDPVLGVAKGLGGKLGGEIES